MISLECQETGSDTLTFWWTVHLQGFHRPCAEGAARDKMDAPAVGTTGVTPEGERPPYVAFFSTAIGATAGIRTFAGRRQTVPGVCFTVTAASSGVKRGEFAAMWANRTDFCSRLVSSTPTALAVAQELLSRDAETAGVFGQDADAPRRLQVCTETCSWWEGAGEICQRAKETLLNRPETSGGVRILECTCAVAGATSVKSFCFYEVHVCVRGSVCVDGLYTYSNACVDHYATFLTLTIVFSACRHRKYSEKSRGEGSRIVNVNTLAHTSEDKAYGGIDLEEAVLSVVKRSEETCQLKTIARCTARRHEMSQMTKDKN